MTTNVQRLVAAAKAAKERVLYCDDSEIGHDTVAELSRAIKAVESETAVSLTAEAQAQPAISEEQIKAMASECEDIALDADYAMVGVPSAFAFEEIIRRHIKHTGSTNANGITIGKT